MQIRGLQEAGRLARVGLRFKLALLVCNRYQLLGEQSGRDIVARVKCNRSQQQVRHDILPHIWARLQLYP